MAAASEYTKSGDGESTGIVATEIDDLGTITVTNSYTPETVDVVLTKTWDDDLDPSMRPSTDEFANLVELTADGTKVTATPDVTASDDQKTYTVTWSGLTKYKVGEVGQLVKYVVSEKEITEVTSDATYLLYNNGEIKAVGDSAYVYEVTNSRNKVQVYLGKQVTGNLGDRNADFHFTVTVKGADGKTDITIANVSGEDIVRKHGNASPLGEFPVGAVVTIEETVVEDYDAAEYGMKEKAEEANAAKSEKAYSVTFTVSNEGNTVTFYNNKAAIIDTGIPTESKPYLMLLALIPLAGAALVIGARRRRRAEV